MENLRFWEYFVAVAEERHFGRAAARLHMAQPPLSRQIQQLEQRLDVRLLYRTNRQELTPAGVVFLDHARRVLADAARAVEETQATARGEAGCLRMGFVSSASHRVLPQLLPVFRARYPHVRMSLTVGTSLEQITMLQNDQLDVGLVRSVGLPDTFHARQVEAAPLAAILLPEDPLALRDRLTLSDLAGRPLVVYPRVDNPAIYDGIVAQCRVRTRGRAGSERNRDRRAGRGRVRGCLGNRDRLSGGAGGTYRASVGITGSAMGPGAGMEAGNTAGG